MSAISSTTTGRGGFSLDAWMSAAGSLVSMVLGSGGVIVSAFSLFILPLVKQFGWSRSDISLAFSISVLVSAVSYPSIGWLMDRYGVKRVTLISILGLATCFFVLSLTTGLAMFYSVFLIIGFFGPGQSPMPYAKIVCGWFDRNRGLVLGLVMAGSGLSAALLPLYLRHLIDAYGWRGGYVGLGLAVIIVPGLAVGLLVRNPPGSEEKNSEGPPLPGLLLSEAVRTYAFWAMAAAIFGATLALIGINAHLLPLLTDHGIAVARATGLLFWLGIGSIFGRIASGVLFDRFPATLVTAIVFAIGAAGIGLLLGRASGWASVAAVMCLGISLGGETDAIGYLSGRYFGLRRLGAINGCYFSIFAIASALGPLIMGRAFDTGHSYDKALWTFLPGMLIAIGLIVSLGPYRYEEQ